MKLVSILKNVANCFNNFFTTVASKMVDKLPSSFNLFHIESFTFKECNGHKIKAQNSVKYLGLNLDNQLSGKAIVNNIVQKVNARLKFLYWKCSFLEEKLRKSVCSALIQCHFDYACSSWYSGLNRNLKKKLHVKIKLFGLYKILDLDPTMDF